MSSPFDPQNQPSFRLDDPLGSPLSRSIFEAAREGLLVLDAQGVVLALNTAFAELYGIDAETTIGHPYTDFARHLEIRRLGKFVDAESWVTRRALDGERVDGVMQNIRNAANGREFVARCGAVPHFENGRLSTVTVTVEDVTETMRALQRVEGALLASEVGIYRIDLVDEKLWADANLAHIYGLSEEDVQGGPRSKLYENVHPEDFKRVAQAIGHATRTGAPHEIEYRVTLPDGSVRWLLSRGRAELNESGVAVQRVGSIVDITHQKVAEETLRRNEVDLERKVAERTAQLQAANEALEQFTHHVAHDLRSPLRSIVSTSRMAILDHGDAMPPAALDMLDRQAKSAKRMALLIDDLLEMARLSRTQARRKPIDLTALASEAKEEALAQHPETRVRVHVADAMQAEADPRLLKLVLVNLIENAVKYSPEGGTVRVGRRDDGTFFVADEGIGIDPKYLDKVFEPFQRLHREERFKGTGIGLSNVRQIVTLHGGRVWAESVPAEGSTFLFTLSE